MLRPSGVRAGLLRALSWKKPAGLPLSAENILGVRNMSSDEIRLDDAVALGLARGVLAERQWDRISDGIASHKQSIESCLADIELRLLVPTSADVTSEVARTANMLLLRKDFQREVVMVTGRPPANEAFNAWLFVQLARSHCAGLPDGEHLFVPLAPPPSPSAAGHHWPLVKYLQRARDRADEAVDADAEPVEAQAAVCDAWLRQRWEQARAQVLADAAVARARCEGIMAGTGEEEADSAQCFVVHGEELADGGFRVWLGGGGPEGQKSEHRINAACASKLRRGFRGADQDWNSRLFLLLHRYACVFGPSHGEGRGWQLATPPAAMDGFSQDFGVDAECFASPMNRRQPRYCSAFLDTDAPFGSEGNFFAAARRGVLASFGSAECGPPYDDELMRLAVEALDVELSRRERDEAGRAGSFVLVVPDWSEPPSQFWRAAKVSRHLAHVLSLDKERHRYIEGFQHQASSARTRFIQGECATLCIWMQNAAGREKYPVSEEKLERQRQAWDLPPR